MVIEEKGGFLLPFLLLQVYDFLAEGDYVAWFQPVAVIFIDSDVVLHTVILWNEELCAIAFPVDRVVYLVYHDFVVLVISCHSTNIVRLSELANYRFLERFVVSRLKPFEFAVVLF